MLLHRKHYIKTTRTLNNTVYYRILSLISLVKSNQLDKSRHYKMFHNHRKAVSIKINELTYLFINNGVGKIGRRLVKVSDVYAARTDKDARAIPNGIAIISNKQITYLFSACPTWPDVDRRSLIIT